MKKAIVFLGGEIHNYRKLKNYDFTNYDIFCADSGAMHTKKLNLIPNFILGDFDSIDTETLNFYKNKTEFINYPIEKNFTDGELVINKIYDSYEKILILGGLGGVHSHLFGNIFLLEKYPRIKFIGENEEIFKVNNFFEFSNLPNVKVSFIPLDSVNVISLSGFKYNLNNELVNRGDTLTLGNYINEPLAKCDVSKGNFICIVEK